MARFDYEAKRQAKVGQPSLARRALATLHCQREELQAHVLQLFTLAVKEELSLGQKRKDLPEDLLASLGLGLLELLERHPQTLSGGEQQRLMIAASLMSDKSVFIFDEPTSNLDADQLQAFVAQVIQLKEAGKAVLIISHDVELMAQVCDEVYHL